MRIIRIYAIHPSASPSSFGTPFHAMYVCVCNAITDREVRAAVALGATTLEDLTAGLGVASCCARCADCARGILAEPEPAAACRAGGDD